LRGLTSRDDGQQARTKVVHRAGFGVLVPAMRHYSLDSSRYEQYTHHHSPVPHITNRTRANSLHVQFSTHISLLNMLPTTRLVESVLLVLALTACLTMWALSRQLQQPYASATLSATMDSRTHEATYCRLRNSYLSVYGLATFGDWIQGGFLYALHAEYGYSMNEIGLIFVAGYASAMTVGTYVAALGDSGGHRRNCIAYGLIYAASCLLCNFKSLRLLLLARLVGGIAYSILYTSFESWLISQADAQRLPMPLLGRLFR